MDVQNGASGSSESCKTPDTQSSPDSCGVCPHLVTSLNRQAAAMERLADLLPQLIAQNLMLIETIADRDPDETDEPRYLDGSPIGAQGATRP